MTSSLLTQPHHLVWAVDAVQPIAGVCSATPAASTVAAAVGAAPTAHTAGEISLLHNGSPARD